MINMVDILALLVAVISSVVAFVAVVNTSREATQNMRVAWTQQVYAWASDCILSVSNMHVHMKEAENIAESDRVRELANLTSLIDQGRLLFVSDKNNDIGRDNPSAYQGLRPKLLDYLVFSYQLYKQSGLSTEEKIAAAYKIIEYKRLFVSEVQDIIEPKWFFEKARIFSEENG